LVRTAPFKYLTDYIDTLPYSIAVYLTSFVKKLQEIYSNLSSLRRGPSNKNLYPSTFQIYKIDIQLNYARAHSCTIAIRKLHMLKAIPDKLADFVDIYIHSSCRIA
jgi:hypothetical protein